MARVPNPYAGQTTESLIRSALERGRVPAVCDECGAVSAMAPETLLEKRDSPAKALSGLCSCGGHFEVADLDGPVGPTEPEGWVDAYKIVRTDAWANTSGIYADEEAARERADELAEERGGDYEVRSAGMRKPEELVR